jgi:hypothetical protein
MPEMARSDTVAALAAWLVAAVLLACVAGDAAGLWTVVLEPLEQAAATTPIPAAPIAQAIEFLMVMLPRETRPGLPAAMRRTGGLSPGMGVGPYYRVRTPPRAGSQVTPPWAAPAADQARGVSRPHLGSAEQQDHPRIRAQPPSFGAQDTVR